MIVLTIIPAFCVWFLGELRLGHRLTWSRLRNEFRLLLRQQKLFAEPSPPPAIITTALVRVRSESICYPPSLYVGDS